MIYVFQFVLPTVGRVFNLPKGLQWAAPILGKSIVWPVSKTFVPGMNFKLFGFGVSCVCMNIDRQEQALNNGTLLSKFLVMIACETPL